jgi:hypothetical protein
VSDQHPPVPAPISTGGRAPRLVRLVTEDSRLKPAPTSTETPPTPSVERRTEPPAAKPEPPAVESELSLNNDLDLPGVGKVRAGGRARGTPAIEVLQCVAIVVAIVVGVVVIAAIIARTRREEPRRPDLGRCTEHIERTPHAEYIGRTCISTGS